MKKGRYLIKYTQKYIEGIFVEECKNRFLCMVEVDGTTEMCYVASSANLKNFLNLSGKTVLLSENKGKQTRTRYTLFAVKLRSQYALLNLNMINSFLDAGAVYLLGKQQIAQIAEREKRITAEYKCDLFYGGNNPVVVEAKAVLSDCALVHFPSVQCYRNEKQLKALEQILDSGLDVYYCLVVISPTIKDIELRKNAAFLDALSRCIRAGMTLRVVRLNISSEKNVSLENDRMLENKVLSSIMESGD